MDSDRHIIVIGGGAIGVCVAYFLSRRGARVTLVERGGIASAASFGNAGLISLGHLPLPRPGLLTTSLRWMLDRTSPLYIPPRLDLGLMGWLLGFARACSRRQLERSMEVVTALSRGTIELFDHFAQEAGVEFEYRHTGYMDVYRSEKAFSAARRDAAYLRARGFPERELSGEEVMSREPALLSGVVGAIRHEDSAYASPAAFVEGVAEAAARLGASIETETEVSEIGVREGRFSHVACRDGRRIEGDVVVIAAGVWSTGLAERIGVRVPMQAAKGYHVNVEPPDPGLRGACMLGDSFVICTPINGYLRLAGTLELSGLNHELRRERLEMLVEQASRYLPGIREARVISRWCGLRPCTADGLPAVGWAPGVGNVYVSTGHSMMGFWTAPMTGKVVSEQILGDGPSLDMGPMRLERFG